MSIRIDTLNKPVSLVLLAGGRASRMGGRNKALLRVKGAPIIKNIISELKPLFENVVIIANDKAPYKNLGLAAYEDIIPGRGPLSGIHSSLLNTKSYYNFVVACDMPYVEPKLARHMLNKLQDGYEVIACKIRGRYEPLFAIYGKGCISAIEEQLATADTKVTRFFSKVRVKTISEKEVTKIDPELKTFRNINTVREYENMLGDPKDFNNYARSAHF